MDIEAIPQLNLGDVSYRRFGDVISSILSESNYTQFHFAVAYMRESGIGRLHEPIEDFVGRGGTVKGAIGVGGRITGRDTGVTSREALESLRSLAPNSTVFTTTSDIIFHPKVYAFFDESSATLVVGSANVTRDGLYRNVEFGSVIYLDFSNDGDGEVWNEHRDFLKELLDTSNPNVQPVDDDIISRLVDDGIIKSETEMIETDTSGGSGGQTTLPESTISEETREMFPTLEIDTPPGRTDTGGVSGMEVADRFIVQLSDFDTSHRSDTPGTSEILIPKGSLPFFPELTAAGGTTPDDCYFDVIMPTASGEESYNARLWHYVEREEFRLRVDPEMIDITTPGGGDLLVIDKLPDNPDHEYEFSIVKDDDGRFDSLLDQCSQIASGGKRWGFTDT